MQGLDGSVCKIGPGTEGQQAFMHKGIVIECWEEVARRASDEKAYTTVKVADIRVSSIVG